MTSLQLKHGFGKTVSGSLNQKQQQGKFKQIQLADDDVQMISPQFLQSKTLKKPLADYGLNFSKNFSNSIKAQNDKTQKNAINSNFHFQPLKSVEDLTSNLQKTQRIDYSFITLDKTTHIKPAYKPLLQDVTLKQQRPTNDAEFSLDDNNTIFSAILKKGSKPKKTISFADNNSKLVQQKQTEVKRSAGNAQNKLKQLFNKNVIKPSNFAQIDVKRTQNKKFHQSQDIQEEIQQSINEYADDGFENYSGESAIKESIREQFGASSGSAIKQSIRQEFGISSTIKHRKSEIIEEIQESIRASISASKEQIPEFIGSYKSSKSNIREEIKESLSGSRKSGEEVYEQIFEEYEDSLKNSRSAFKKSGNFKEKEDVLSKSFRKKTNVVKSIKLAEEIMNQHKVDLNEDYKKDPKSVNKYSEKLTQQKKQIMKKKADISELFNKKAQPYEIPDKNKNLLYQFKIEMNKLFTSQNFESKLRKLTSFINFGENQAKNAINSLEDEILANILGHINNIKKPALDSHQIQKLKADYDEKLNIMLKDQEINLRVQMDKKIHEKDMEFKKMIAELQKKFEGKALASAGAKINNFIGSQQNIQGNNSGLYEVESDYSIDSENVSWKADLWEVLPEYEKKKLYEKQTKEVTNFLTQIMMNQLKEQSLHRDLDISFQFPDEFNQSNGKNSSLPSLNGTKRVLSTEDFMPKAAFNRKEFQQNISVNHSQQSKKQSIFPDFQRPKSTASQQFDFKRKEKQTVNQYSKIEGEIIPQSTKKLKIEKEKILQVLSKYKSSYIRKKNDTIRKILKTLKPKDMKKVPEDILSVIQQITILSKEDVNASDMVYVRAYEEELVWALVNTISKNENKKTQFIEEEMRKNYERLVVICQAKVAETAEEVVCLDIYQENKELAKLKDNTSFMSVKPCPLEIPMKEEAVCIIEKKEEKKIKNELVDNIINILMMEFAKDFPKRKK